LKGCVCTKSKCKKNYCECFKEGITCTDICNCESCENRPDHLVIIPNTLRNVPKKKTQKSLRGIFKKFNDWVGVSGYDAPKKIQRKIDPEFAMEIASDNKEDLSIYEGFTRMTVKNRGYMTKEQSMRLVQVKGQGKIIEPNPNYPFLKKNVLRKKQMMRRCTPGQARRSRYRELAGDKKDEQPSIRGQVKFEEEYLSDVESDVLDGNMGEDKESVSDEEFVPRQMLVKSKRKYKSKKTKKTKES
jgi:hypothetical protein